MTLTFLFCFFLHEEDQIFGQFKDVEKLRGSTERYRNGKGSTDTTCRKVESMKEDAKGKANSNLKYLIGSDSDDANCFLSSDYIASGNSHKLQPGRFKLDIRRTFVMRRVVQWSILPCALPSPPSLEIFQTKPQMT